MLPWLCVRWQRDQSTIPDRSLHTGPGGPYSLPFNVYQGLFPSGLRWPRHEADHSSPLNAEVKDVCSYTSNGYTNFSSEQATSTFPAANPSQFHFLTAVPYTLLSELPFDYHISQCGTACSNIALYVEGGPGSYLSSEKGYCRIFHDNVLSLKP